MAAAAAAGADIRSAASSSSFASWLALVLAACCCFAPPAAQALAIVRQLSSCSVLTDGGTIDLSPLSRSGSPPRFANVASKNYPTAVFYDWNPCNDYSEPETDPAKLCGQVAVCAVLPQSVEERALDSTYIPYGNQASANFTIVDGQLALRYTDLPVGTEAIIVIQCSATSGDSVTCTSDANYQSVQFTYSGPSGCFSKTNSSLSTGSILCIVFAAFIALYFGIGALVVKFVKKPEQGAPIPNSGFWSQLPVYVKDGFFYSIRFVRKQRPGYEDI